MFENKISYQWAKILFFSIGLSNASVLAQCILPAPDGGIKNVSNRNVAGKILHRIGRTIFIRDFESKKIFSVSIPKNNEIYTAFGGGDKIDVLKPGQSARVWLTGCYKATKNKGVSAYFEIFSYDVEDIPNKDYFYKNGQ